MAGDGEAASAVYIRWAFARAGPVAPNATATKAGDNLARLLAAQIGTERAGLAFTSILTAATAEQAEADRKSVV